MYKIVCNDLTQSGCAKVFEGEDKEKLKQEYYAHGQDPEHIEQYKSATDEQKQAFGTALNDYLDKQG